MSWFLFNFSWFLIFSDTDNTTLALSEALPKSAHLFSILLLHLFSHGTVFPTIASPSPRIPPDINHNNFTASHSKQRESSGHVPPVSLFLTQQVGMSRGYQVVSADKDRPLSESSWVWLWSFLNGWLFWVTSTSNQLLATWLSKQKAWSRVKFVMAHLQLC